MLDEEVRILGTEGNFYKVEYTDKSGQFTSGYMLQNDIDN